MAVHTVTGLFCGVFWYMMGGLEMSQITYIGNSAGANFKKLAINYAKIGTYLGAMMVLTEILFFCMTRNWIAQQYL